MNWFLEYMVPFLLIGGVFIIVLSFVPVFFIVFSSFGKLFKSFDGFDKLFKSFGDLKSQNAKAQNSEGYKCHSCGAALGDKIDVSPSGDVKCKYCNKWFNIHKNS